MNSQTTSNNLIGIVTVLYNSDEVLPDFFTSLAAQTGVRFRLYVIDNSAGDSGLQISRTLAEQYGVDARFIFNNANLGVATGNNQGIQMALDDGCEYVLLANNDTKFNDPDTLLHLVNRLSESGDAAATPKINYFASNKIWCYGGYISLLRATTPHYQQGKEDLGQLDHLRTVGYAPTCFMMIHRKTFDRIGMMDEKYFVYYDDADFVYRMGLAKLQITFVPECKIFHKVSFSTGGDFSPFSIYYGTRNRIYFIRKHFHGFRLGLSLFVTFLALTASVVKTGGECGRSVLRGLRDGFLLKL